MSQRNSRHAPGARSGGLLVCILLACHLCNLGAVAEIRGGDEIGEQMERALGLYQSARFDEAIALLQRLNESNALPLEQRRETLRLLGRAYTAKGFYDKARAAITEMLALEPPMIEFDPERESPPMMRIYYDARKQRSGSLQIERPDPGLQTVAVLDFTNNAIDDRDRFAAMQQGFAVMMINELKRIGGVKIVERERIQWLLNELQMQRDARNFDPAMAVAFGRQIGAHAMLLGSYIIFKKQLWLSVRLVSVKTGEILATADERGDVDKFFTVTGRLSATIARRIAHEQMPQEDQHAASETRVLEALLAYSEGLELVERAQYGQAYKKFLAAVEYDPTYEQALHRAETLEPLLH